MAKHSVAVSRATQDALAVLGSQIRAARIARGWTQPELAARVGVHPRTISSLENGSPTVAIGTVFNAAFTTGVNLFGLEGDELALARRRGEETLALLPSHVRPSRSAHGRAQDAGDDDF